MEANLPLNLLLLAGLFGLLLGSFLNVCIYRVPRDVSVVAPRSFCPECGKQIRWWDNVPVLSYALLKGRCRNCGLAISARYPLVEMLTAVLFVCTAARYGLTLSGLKWMIFEAVLVVLFWTDLEERILPDAFTMGGSTAGLLLMFAVPVPGALPGLLVPGWQPVWQSVLNVLLANVVLLAPIWGLSVLVTWLRKRESLGLGDLKLILMIAIYLGLENGVTALLIGAVTGTITGVGYIMLTHKKASEYELPFGSFLCIGAAVVPLVKKLG